MSVPAYEDSRAFAEAEDRRDPLARFRAEFNFPRDKDGLGPVYLCGNSLGLQPERGARYVRDELANWADWAVDGHFHSERPWTSYHKHAVAGFCELTGSKPREVIAMNTLTVNLHVLMASFYKPTSERYKIVVESKAFPSDRYAAASQLRLHGHDPEEGLIEWRSANDDGYYDHDDLEAIVREHGDGIALLLLPGVQYYTGQVMDMQRMCELGREAGCAVGLDLAHAVGNVPMQLHDWAPDFAAWCTYKYLNSGPGAIGGAFIHERHLTPDNLDQLHGWWGNAEETRFEMRKRIDPADGAELWQMSNPPILSMAPIMASLELFMEAGLGALTAKAERLTGYLAWLIERRFAGRIGTLTPERERGCQLSLIVRDHSLNGKAIFDRLCELNVTGDWREPDVIRIAPAPLYNSFVDVHEFAERFERALERG